MRVPSRLMMPGIDTPAKKISDRSDRTRTGGLGHHVRTCRAPGSSDAISAAGDNSKRALECSFIKAVGLNLISLISPSAHIGIGCSIGAGCLVGSHAHLGPQSIVGDGCIINTGAIVEHESRVGMYSHIAVNAAIAGKSSVGNFCMLGIGSSVGDGVSITDCVIVGAGGVVHCPITQAGTYVGVPARKIK